MALDNIGGEVFLFESEDPEDKGDHNDHKRLTISLWAADYDRVYVSIASASTHRQNNDAHTDTCGSFDRTELLRVFKVAMEALAEPPPVREQGQ